MENTVLARRRSQRRNGDVGGNAVNPPNPTDRREWWRENWQLPSSWATCSRCGVKILRSHLAEGVCRDMAACDATLTKRKLDDQERIGANLPSLADMEALAIAFEFPEPEPVAMARTADGSPVVALAPKGIEVCAFTAENLDECGMPRWLEAQS